MYSQLKQLLIFLIFFVEYVFIQFDVKDLELHCMHAALCYKNNTYANYYEEATYNNFIAL